MDEESDKSSSSPGSMDEETNESSLNLDFIDENEDNILEKMKAYLNLDMENLKEASILN